MQSPRKFSFLTLCLFCYSKSILMNRCTNQKEREEEGKVSIFHANALKVPKGATPPSFSLDTVVLFLVPLLRYAPFRFFSSLFKDSIKKLTL